MKYDFECQNKKCEKANTIKEVEISIKDTIEASCKVCNNSMKRIWNTHGLKTADGRKY